MQSIGRGLMVVQVQPGVRQVSGVSNAVSAPLHGFSAGGFMWMEAWGAI